jgi:hypothetical protein
MSTVSVDLAECPNCGAPLHAAFCATCGQKAAPLNPSLGEFLHDLAHELVHVDGKIVQSVGLLLARPGFLSREQFHGRRARYISPIRLYLVFSVLYFAVAAFAPTSAIRITATPDPGEDPRQLEAKRVEIEHTVNEVLTHWTPRAMFVLVPVFAGFVMLAVRRRAHRNYPQHLYFALHVHAAWFAAALVATLLRIAAVPYVTPVVTNLAFAYGAVYFVVALRRTYDLSVAAAIVRAVLIEAIYFVVVLAVLLAIAIPFLRAS